MSDPIHARLVKTSTFPDAVIEPNGARGNGPITDQYTVLGYYLSNPTIGQPFQMVRYSSQGVEALGIYTTSPVTSFDLLKDGSITFNTLNSTYLLTSI